MKYVIASDLHGSEAYVTQLLETFRREEADMLLLLGDYLYHGPRNRLPEAYDTQRVAALLNPLADKIIAVRGNCDAEVDQLVLSFPMTADYNVLLTGSRRLFLTHGHIYNAENPPHLGTGDVVLSGHTHVPASFCSRDGIWFLNPGSTSLPKAGSPHSYMTLEGDSFLWKELSDGEVYRELSLA